MTDNRKKAAETALEAFTDFVNGAGLTGKQAFVDALMRQHRTLQQESFDLMFQAFEAWAKLDDNQIDARNSGAVRLSKEIAKLINAPIDYPALDIKLSLDTKIAVGTNFKLNPLEVWQFTKIDSVEVIEVDGINKFKVDGRAKRIYE